ncbi:endonuclease/exonuclease/phosphatase family protein [Bosea thiooxidans]
MPHPAPDAAKTALRVLSYNVRRCLGLDRRYSPQRIAQVIAECSPDVVALQELDVGRLRSGGVDQAQAIARELGFGHLHFSPALRHGEELYGDALLTRQPSRLVRTGTLPEVPNWRKLESRGAVWIALPRGGTELQILNTHFGIGRRERIAQARALLGPSWLDHPDCRAPVVLLGDFNSLPGGRVHRALSMRLHDANRGGPATFPTVRPLFRIDHVFASDDLTVRSVKVHRSPLASVASDHFPVYADLALEGSLA